LIRTVRDETTLPGPRHHAPPRNHCRRSNPTGRSPISGLTPSYRTRPPPESSSRSPSSGPPTASPAPHQSTGCGPTAPPGTFDSYQKIVRLRIIPQIGGMSLQALDEPTVERWVAGLSASGLSAKTVRNGHGVLSISLRDALRLRLVSHNAATAAQLPKVPKQKPRAWSTEEVRRFLNHVRSDRWAPLWRLLATTGMRRGEALGLRWHDVDLEEGVVTVANTRTVVTGRVVSGPPKTTSAGRTIALDSVTATTLRAWRRQQSAERLVMGADWPNTDIVFTWQDGRSLYPQGVTKWFRAIAAEVNLPQIGVHGLRHTAATWMISSGVSPKLVAERLGHSNVSTTLSLYSHVLPGHDRAAAEALAAAFDLQSVTNP
jgi:integrase